MDAKQILEKKTLYKPFYKADVTPYNKKYSVYIMKDGNKKLIHFGQIGYDQYKDKLGRYKAYDHLDQTRRIRYRKRASKIKNKIGNLTYQDKNSPNYWAYNILW